MREWVSQEDAFVLKQARKKAEIRVKEGRARPIDWLTVILRVIDPTRHPLDDEFEDDELELVDPDGVFEGVSDVELSDLEKDIETFLHLETNPKNRDYWKTMKVICRDRRKQTRPEGRAMNSVSADIDRLLSPKTYEELEALENQVLRKLDSNEPIDTDYWESLMKRLLVWKAKAKLKKVFQAVIDSRLQDLRSQQTEKAASLAKELLLVVGSPQDQTGITSQHIITPIAYDKALDPDSMLQLRPEEKSLGRAEDEGHFLKRVTLERRKILKMGYVPSDRHHGNSVILQQPGRANQSGIGAGDRGITPILNDELSQATKDLYEREVARGVGDNEEIFAGEETVDTKSKHLWDGKYRPRKPKYFNRVQMGYEWNKYNQTHYDHDNPPPKVVQGYKFNIFYPDLIDKAKAPTYKIEREGGRKKGQSFASAGEEDTCLIRFISGPPYEDIAFRIVDKEWDYSAKRERGFKSSFDKGILQLHFQFKKVYYRK